MYPNLEYLSGNKAINFPFRENIVLPPQIKQDFFVDLYIVTKYWQEDFYISEIIYKINEFVFIFNDAFPLIIGDSDLHLYESPDCIIKALTYNKQFNFPYNSYAINKNNSLVEHCCVSPIGNCLNSITVGEDILYGDIRIKAGYNIGLTKLNNQIIITALKGLGLGCPDCSHKIETDFITKINGDAMQSHNITIEGNDCIQIENLPNENMIVVHDRCKPCCENCPERTEVVSTDNEQMETDLISLEARIEALEA